MNERWTIKQVPISELKLGDTVEVFEDAFGSAVVNQIKDGSVHFFRPYATTEDFSYTGGVIPYIGIETFTRPTTDTSTVKVWRRKEVK
jgi:hypothetical protein